MNRAELDGMDREALIALAEAAGVTRARILTRPELVDELLIRSTVDRAARERARGLFGLARDLLARVVERGLHLPDTAERIRAMGVAPQPRRAAPAALPTVTLAEIYAAQGHRDRAVETLQGVLAREPEHAAARALLAQLQDASYPVPPPRMPPEAEQPAVVGTSGAEPAGAAPTSPMGRGAQGVDHARAEPGRVDQAAEPTHVLDDATLPQCYDVDECVAIPVDPRTLYVYWEVRERTLDYIRATRPRGTLAVRIVVVVPTWDGPESSVRDHEAAATLGEWFVHDLPAGCVVRAAIGWKYGDVFLPVAHSPALEAAPGAPSPLVADVLVRWTPRGTFAVASGDGDAASIDRALGRVRREAVLAWRGREVVPTEGPTGSSERWVNAPGS